MSFPVSYRVSCSQLDSQAVKEETGDRGWVPVCRYSLCVTDAELNCLSVMVYRQSTDRVGRTSNAQLKQRTTHLQLRDAFARGRLPLCGRRVRQRQRHAAGLAHVVGVPAAAVADAYRLRDVNRAPPSFCLHSDSLIYSSHCFIPWFPPCPPSHYPRPRPSRHPAPFVRPLFTPLPVSAHRSR